MSALPPKHLFPSPHQNLRQNKRRKSADGPDGEADIEDNAAKGAQAGAGLGRVGRARHIAGEVAHEAGQTEQDKLF